MEIVYIKGYKQNNYNNDLEKQKEEKKIVFQTLEEISRVAIHLKTFFNRNTTNVSANFICIGNITIMQRLLRSNMHNPM